MVRQDRHLVAQYLDIIVFATVHDEASILDQVLTVCSIHLRCLMNGDFPRNKNYHCLTWYVRSISS